MVLPTDFLQDSVILGFVSVVGLIIKLVLKPSKVEAELVSRVLMGIAVLVLQIFRRWQKDHKDHTDKILSELQILKNKFNKRKEVLG